jgi:MFS transporter, DHA2 family, multidrug resistance protein
MLLGGVGMGSAMAPVTAAAMQSVRPDKAGVGSAVLNSMRQVGGSLGIAIMGAIVAASTSPGRRDPVAFLHGFHHALETAAGIALLGALIAALTLPKSPQPERERDVAFSRAG